MSRYLLIHADDFGHPAGAVEAITDLFAAGVVTSASAMVNMPDWPRAAALLRQHPEWDAGLHLVMNEGAPLLPPRQVRSLVDRQGCFYNHSALLAHAPFISVRQLRREWEAQLARFIADVGRPPTHVDQHCYYPYILPAWFRLSLDLAVACGNVPVRVPFDDALEQKAQALAAEYARGAPTWLVLWRARNCRRMVARAGLAHTNYWDTSFSRKGGRTVEALLDLLDRLPEGITEMVCHPGTEGWRNEDYQALRDPRARERIAARGIELVDYRWVAAHGVRG